MTILTVLRERYGAAQFIVVEGVSMVEVGRVMRVTVDEAYRLASLPTPPWAPTAQLTAA